MRKLLLVRKPLVKRLLLMRKLLLARKLLLVKKLLVRKLLLVSDGSEARGCRSRRSSITNPGPAIAAVQAHNLWCKLNRLSETLSFFRYFRFSEHFIVIPVVWFSNVRGWKGRSGRCQLTDPPWQEKAVSSLDMTWSSGQARLSWTASSMLRSCE